MLAAPAPSADSEPSDVRGQLNSAYVALSELYMSDIKFQIFRFKIQLKPSSRLERLSHNSRLQTVKLLLYLEMLYEATKYVNM